MNWKKFIVSVTSLALIATSTPPININTDDILNTVTVNADNLSTTYSSWQEAYNSILQDDDFFKETYGAGYTGYDEESYPGVSSMYFDLIYLDDDDIPELVVYFDGAHYSGPSIVKYDETTGTVGFILRSDYPTIHLSEYGEFGVLNYIEKEGIIYDNEAGMGYQRIYLFEVNGYTAELKEHYSVESYTSGNPDSIICYDSNEVEVSIDEIAESLEEYGLEYTGVDETGYLAFTGYKTVSLQLNNDNLNTQANRTRIIGDVSSNPQTSTSSTCGDNATWSFDESTGTLTISGTGDMYDYEKNTYPFGNIQVTSIVIEEGITSIGSWLFENIFEFGDFSSEDINISLPSTLTSIGDYAFCTVGTSVTNLSSITIPKNVTYIGEYAIGYGYNMDGSDSILKINNFIIYGYSDSAAETYANENGLTFVALDDDGNDSSTTTTTNQNSTIVSGSCGDNATYSFDESTGILTISGTGDMYDYDGVTLTPWYSYKDDIKVLVIENGITKISSGVFQSCISLENVIIPDSVTQIGDYAFWNCTSLTNVYYTGTEEEWNAIIFGANDELLIDATIYYNYDSTTITVTTTTTMVTTTKTDDSTTTTTVTTTTTNANEDSSPRGGDTRLPIAGLIVTLIGTSVYIFKKRK